MERKVLAPRTDISFDRPNSDRSGFLRTTGKRRVAVATFGLPHLDLGGFQVDTRANRARSRTTSRRDGIVLVNPRSRATKTLQTPAGASISAETRSPTGTQVAYIANFADASVAYVADVATGRSTRVASAPLLATHVTSVSFTADGRQLLVVLVPGTRWAAPMHGADGIEDGPQVRLTGSRAVPQPVHASLLADAHEKALLKYHTTGQLALLDVAKRTVRTVGQPAMICSVDAAADAAYFRVTQMIEPFSYLVPVSSFGTAQELWDASRKLVTTLSRDELREERVSGDDFGDGDGAPTASDNGKRSIQWDPAGPGLVYLQSMFVTPPPENGAGRPTRGGAPADGVRGAASRVQPSSVRYLQWRPSFGATDSKVLNEGGAQLSSVAWSADASTMCVNDSGVDSAIGEADPTKKFSLGHGVTLPATGGRFGGGDGFGVPGGGNAPPDTLGTRGALATRRGPNGQSFVGVANDGKSVFVEGTRQYGAEWARRAPRPWTAGLEIESGVRACSRRLRVLPEYPTKYPRSISRVSPPVVPPAARRHPTIVTARPPLVGAARTP